MVSQVDAIVGTNFGGPDEGTGNGPGDGDDH